MVYAMAVALVGASLLGTYGVLQVRDAQADAARAALAYDAGAALFEGTAPDGATSNASGQAGPPVAPVAEDRPTPPPATPPAETSQSPNGSAGAPPPVTPTATAPSRPPPDADRDGFPDAIDRCPSRPETRNGYLDRDGCPDIITTTRAS